MSKETFCRELNVDEGGTAQVGQEQEFYHSLIEDSGVFFPDYSSGQEEIITLEYHLPDDKVRLRLFPSVSIFNVDTSQIPVPTDDLPEPKAEIDIPHGQPFKMPIKDLEKGEVMLVVRDIPSDQVTLTRRHVIVPLGLRHYN